MSWKGVVEKAIRDAYVVGHEFTLADLYKRSEDKLQQQFPKNSRIRQTLRNILQQLRNDGFIEFVDNDGTYRRLR